MGGEAENTRGRETAGEGWRSQIAKKVFNDYDESKVVVVLVVMVVVAGSGAVIFRLRREMVGCADCKLPSLGGDGFWSVEIFVF